VGPLPKCGVPVNFLSQAATFLTSGANWSGSNGIPALLLSQVKLSVVAVVCATLAGVGLGSLLGHTGRGSFAVLNAANAARAIPSFALIILLAIQPAIAKLQESGFVAASIAMFALAVPPILTNTYIGVREVAPEVRSAALAMGMRPGQLLWRVELPLARPLILAGARTAAVEVVATATLAAYVGYPDLGTYIFTGLAVNSNVETFSGAFLVAVVALAVDSLMAAAGRALTPAGLRGSGAHKDTPALRYRALGRIPVVRAQGGTSKPA
jgi:osmoprotectant transport system permease protein